MYLKKNYVTDWENILEMPLGFTRVDNGISLISKGMKYDKLIYIQDRKYFPHGVFIDGISIGISFHNVEKTLNDAYEKTRVRKPSEEVRTIRNVLNQLENVDYSAFSTEINDLKSFQLVNEQIQKIIQQYSLPFFEKYNTLEKVADLLADKKPQEVVPYIQGSILFPKTILILKLVKHPDFNEKLIEYYNILKIQAKKKDTYKDILKVFEELFKEDLPAAQSLPT